MSIDTPAAEGGFQAPPPAPSAPLAAVPPPPSAPAVVRAPKILDWIDVPEYPGFKARVWLNVPQRVVGELGSGDTERSFAALKQVVVAHNGWADDEGTPYPAADTESFWESVMGNGLAGIHLISCIVRGIRDAAANAGNSPRPTRPQ